MAVFLSLFLNLQIPARCCTAPLYAGGFDEPWGGKGEVHLVMRVSCILAPETNPECLRCDNLP